MSKLKILLLSLAVGVALYFIVWQFSDISNAIAIGGFTALLAYNLLGRKKAGSDDLLNALSNEVCARYKDENIMFSYARKVETKTEYSKGAIPEETTNRIVTIITNKRFFQKDSFGEVDILLEDIQHVEKNGNSLTIIYTGERNFTTTIYDIDVVFNMLAQFSRAK